WATGNPCRSNVAHAWAATRSLSLLANLVSRSMAPESALASWALALLRVSCRSSATLPLELRAGAVALRRPVRHPQPPGRLRLRQAAGQQGQQRRPEAAAVPVWPGLARPGGPGRGLARPVRRPDVAHHWPPPIHSGRGKSTRQEVACA